MSGNVEGTHDPYYWQPLSVAEAVQLLRGLPAPWWISGGWAIDLFLGQQTRPHGDLDIQMLRPDQLIVQRHLAGWDLCMAGGGRLRPWPSGQPLDDGLHQAWCRPAAAAPWAMDIIFADTDGKHWVFRRNSRITGPLSELGRVTTDGIPYITPEVQLLFKAKGLRPKDEADFALVLPRLAAASRQWLSRALADTHPGHPWLSRLSWRGRDFTCGPAD